MGNRLHLHTAYLYLASNSNSHSKGEEVAMQSSGLSVMSNFSQCLAQRHFNMCTGGAGNGNQKISGQPALPPEPQLPQMYQL